MFTTSRSNIHIESCIPFDTFINHEFIDDKKMYQYMNRYLCGETNDVPNGYVILYLLSQKCATMFHGNGIGWKDIKGIKKMYEQFLNV